VGCEMLNMPFELVFADGDNLEFRGVFRRSKLHLSEITYIKVLPLDAGGFRLGESVEFRCSRRAILFYQSIDKMDEFMAVLKSLNPSIDVQRS